MIYQYYNNPLLLISAGSNPYYYPDVLLGTIVEYKCFNTVSMTCKIKVPSGTTVPRGTLISEQEWLVACGGN